MAKEKRPGRIDYTPGAWAAREIDALLSADQDLNLQAAIDMLIITGGSARKHGHWVPPTLHGCNRAYWREPLPTSTAVRRSGTPPLSRSVVVSAEDD